MHKTIGDWDGFRANWAGPRNFRIAPEMLPFDFAFPALNRIVDEVRADAEASIKSGRKASKLDLNQDSPDAFRRRSIDDVMDGPFALAHFDIGRFDREGGFLDGFGAQVLDRWETLLRDNGYTWERAYPIIFISGKGSATNYHMDLSHVLAWQAYGTKRFCGLVDPDRWADHGTRVTYNPGKLEKPAAIREEDSLCYDMRPGDKLWNVLLTPHWVEAGDEAAMSLNLSMGGLRLNGALSQNEEELEQYRAAHPETAPARIERRYARSA